jgi:hypothetical protein
MLCKLNEETIDFFPILLKAKQRSDNKSGYFELLLKYLHQCTSTDFIIQQKQLSTQHLHRCPRNALDAASKFTLWYS